jgi:hypothetical protein
MSSGGGERMTRIGVGKGVIDSAASTRRSVSPEGTLRLAALCRCRRCVEGTGERLSLEARTLRPGKAEDEGDLRGDDGLVHGSSLGLNGIGLPVTPPKVVRRDSPPAYTWEFAERKKRFPPPRKI